MLVDNSKTIFISNLDRKYGWGIFLDIGITANYQARATGSAHVVSGVCLVKSPNKGKAHQFSTFRQTAF
jgi:hypothetical protein